MFYYCVSDFFMQERTKKEQSKPPTKLPIESELEEILEKLKDPGKLDGNYLGMKEQAQELIEQMQRGGYDILYRALTYRMRLDKIVKEKGGIGLPPWNKASFYDNMNKKS